MRVRICGSRILTMAEAYQVCGHCGRCLGEKTYKEHKRLYYHDSVWISEKDLLPKKPSDGSDSSKVCSFEPPSPPKLFEEVDEMEQPRCDRTDVSSSLEGIGGEPMDTEEHSQSEMDVQGT